MNAHDAATEAAAIALHRATHAGERREVCVTCCAFAGVVVHAIATAPEVRAALGETMIPLLNEFIDALGGTK